MAESMGMILGMLLGFIDLILLLALWKKQKFVLASFAVFCVCCILSLAGENSTGKMPFLVAFGTGFGGVFLTILPIGIVLLIFGNFVQKHKNVERGLNLLAKLLRIFFR